MNSGGSSQRKKGKIEEMGKGKLCIGTRQWRHSASLIQRAVNLKPREREPKMETCQTAKDKRLLGFRMHVLREVRKLDLVTVIFKSRQIGLRFANNSTSAFRF